MNLHKRIALNIIKITGTTPNKSDLGLMMLRSGLEHVRISNERARYGFVYLPELPCPFYWIIGH